jgi:hypothetical protein
MRSPLPHQTEHVLGIIEYSARDDEIFHLLIKDDGDYFVQIHYSPNRDHSRPYWSDPIRKEDYHKYTIDGTPIITLINKFIEKENGA